MVTNRRHVCAVALVAALLSLATPALAQWYDDEEAPAGEGEILAPFTFNNFRLGSGGRLASFIAPGDDITALTFLLEGGYALDSIPIYIGLELPMSWAQESFGGTSTSEFALGSVGLKFKARIDPDLMMTSVFTGWSLDLYIPTFMGDVDPRTKSVSLAHAAGALNTLRPAIHVQPEAISAVGTFDLVVPGHWVFFQFELSVAAYFPITDIDQRSVEGALLWGAALGVHIARPIAFLIEGKVYTPLGATDPEGTPLDSQFAISSGFRMRFGPFQPAIWVSFPLNEDYRKAWPDVIIGVDLAAWF